MATTKLNAELPIAERLTKKCIPEPMSGCWIWEPCLNHKGYGSFWFGDKNIGAHRASWIVHRGPVPEGKMVLHKCDMRCCINPDHLFIGTAADNSFDMVAKGRSFGLSGEDNKNARLKESDIINIRTLAEFMNAADLSRQFGISVGHCQGIISRRSWRHI